MCVFDNSKNEDLTPPSKKHFGLSQNGNLWTLFPCNGDTDMTFSLNIVSRSRIVLELWHNQICEHEGKKADDVKIVSSKGTKRISRSTGAGLTSITLIKFASKLSLIGLESMMGPSTGLHGQVGALYRASCSPAFLAHFRHFLFEKFSLCMRLRNTVRNQNMKPHNNLKINKN